MNWNWIITFSRAHNVSVNSVYAKFVRCNFRVFQKSHGYNSWLTLFHKICVSVFKIYLYNKFHMLSYRDSLVMDTKPKTKENIHITCVCD